jgi:aldose 1-epimerase
VTDLEIRAGTTRAHVAPSLGFNCFSFVVDGFDYLHAEPDLFPHGSPTRSGIPALFPWPNRIAGSRFTWQGQTYDLPVTEESTGSSLHGFAVHCTWRVLNQQPDEVTAEFLLSKDAPEHAHRWPANAGLRVTYQVKPGSLIVTSVVFCGDDRPLPYGLGFHPYLRVPGPSSQWILQCDATRAWVLQDMIPTGEVVGLPAGLDYREPRRLGEQHLDDVLTGLPTATGMTSRACLASTSRITVSSDVAYREYVLFTPGSRAALAIEPYTCTTDAVHLHQRDVDSGWAVLAPGHQKRSTWRLDVTSSDPSAG